jgi:hypothetical protein
MNFRGSFKVKVFLVLMTILAGNLSQASAMDRLGPVSHLLGQTQVNDSLVADAATNYPIKPSEAALIAQRSVPDSKVLNVKLLPSGEYVVTLKAGGSVQRVMVNATSGATS